MKRFWESKSLAELSEEEWEALCDGCGLCCLHKVEEECSGRIVYTRVTCRLLDPETGRCLSYRRRRELVPECVRLAADRPEAFRWLPETCAYRRLHEGRPLPDWHPLLTGDPASVRGHGVDAIDDLVPEILCGGRPECYPLEKDFTAPPSPPRPGRAG